MTNTSVQRFILSGHKYNRYNTSTPNDCIYVLHCFIDDIVCMPWIGIICEQREHHNNFFKGLLKINIDALKTVL